MDAYGGSGRTVPQTLNLGIRLRCGQFHFPIALKPAGTYFGTELNRGFVGHKPKDVGLEKSLALHRNLIKIPRSSSP
jgi:hypothetical protein